MKLFISYLSADYANILCNSMNLVLSVFGWTIIVTLLKIVFVLVAVAYFTVAERKVMAAVQRRLGPNVVGFWGLLQPLADGFKLICKELLVPTQANSRIFVFAPILILVLSLLSWNVIPFGLYDHTESKSINSLLNFSQINIEHLHSEWATWTDFSEVSDISYGILFILAVSSLNVYGIIIAGWASNSKYAFLGSLRSAAQMISYEVSIGLVILPVVLLANSLNFSEIVAVQERVGWFVFPLLPCAIIFFISMIAETNRAPFDLPEAEAELVAGYNVEYSSIIFAMFFLGEYSNMLLMATVIVILFFGGWLAPLQILSFIPEGIWFSIKIVIFCFLFILVRAALPRYRYDQLMDIGWKIFLPITLSYIIFVVGILLAVNGLPVGLEVPSIYYNEFSLFENQYIKDIKIN